MKNRTIIFILSAVVAAMLMLVTAAEAKPKNYLCKGATLPASEPCTSDELQEGSCTPIRDRYGTFTGYVVRRVSKTDADGSTRFDYNFSVVEGYCPKQIQNIVLELPICTVDLADAIHCPVLDATRPFKVKMNGKGAVSAYLKWFASDLVQIGRVGDDDDDDDDNGRKITDPNFFVTVDDNAYETEGNLGLKVGGQIFTGSILVPVCDASCGLKSFAAPAGTEDDPIVITTEPGDAFMVKSNPSTGCNEVLSCFRPGPPPAWIPSGSLGCIKVPIEEFLEVTKGTGDPKAVKDFASDGCLELVIEDDSNNSPAYISGGWGWY